MVASPTVASSTMDHREQDAGADFGGFTPDEISARIGTPFLAAEELTLLRVAETTLPVRSSLRKVGALRRPAEREATSTPSGGLT